MYTLEAMGQSTYSTRILTVLYYVSFFETYWTLLELHEERALELVYAREYLKKSSTRNGYQQKYLRSNS
jgi:hypothetical protein